MANPCSCLTCPYLTSALLGIVPEQMVLCVGTSNHEVVPALTVLLPLFFIGKKTWLDGGCLKLVTSHAGISRNVTGWAQV